MKIIIKFLSILFIVVIVTSCTITGVKEFECKYEIYQAGKAITILEETQIVYCYNNKTYDGVFYKLLESRCIKNCSRVLK